MTTLTLVLRIIFVVSASIALLSAARQDYHCGLVRRRTFVRAAACQLAASVAVVTGAWFVGWRGFDWLELNDSGLKWLGLESSASARPGLDSSSLTSSAPSPLQASTPMVTQLFTQIVTALSVGVSICALGFLCHRLTKIAGKHQDSAAIHNAYTGVRSKISAQVTASDSAQTQAASLTELSRQLPPHLPPHLPPRLPPQSGFGLADVWAAALSAQTLTLLWPVTDALLLWCLLWFATSVHALVSHQHEEKEPQRKEGEARQLRLLPHLLWTWSVLIPTLLLIHPP